MLVRHTEYASLLYRSLSIYLAIFLSSCVDSDLSLLRTHFSCVFFAKMATIADPKLKSFDAEYVFQADTPQLDILSMVFGPHTQALAPLRPQQCEYLRERENPFFELALKAHSQRAYDEPSPRVLIGQLEPYSVIGKAKGLPFVSAASRMKSSYYSTLTWYEDDCSMEIWYNLVEDHSSSPIDELRMQSKQLYEPVYFSYDLCKGRSTYLLSHSIEPPNMTKPANIMGLHPFSGHLAVLCKEVEARSYAVARGLDTMLAIEQRWLEQPLLRTIDTYVIKTDLQSLHRVARLFIACEHRTGRDLSHVDKLLQDLDRLMVETTKHPHFAQLNSYLHERTKDGFYSLKDSCENIVRRMQTRRMRISNLINLVSPPLFSLHLTEYEADYCMLAFQPYLKSR